MRLAAPLFTPFTLSCRLTFLDKRIPKSYDAAAQQWEGLTFYRNMLDQNDGNESLVAGSMISTATAAAGRGRGRGRPPRQRAAVSPVHSED